MALVGPGSEWFWTALTGLILAITFFAIYRQLSIARSATAVEQLTLFETELHSVTALTQPTCRGHQPARSPSIGNESVASSGVGTLMRSCSGMGVAVAVWLGGSCSSHGPREAEPSRVPPTGRTSSGSPVSWPSWIDAPAALRST